jgi:tryptophanyl-tRNA synthetase
LCGFRPTGRLHLGHYFSVILPGQQGADVLVANYHAPEEQNTSQSVATLRRFGVQNIRLQKDVFDAELYFRLLVLAKMGDLGRMTQFKSCADDRRTAHLLTYPVLMAHDVAGYNEVMVGEDQHQHLQYARKLLHRCNRRFQTTYPIPVANLMGGRVKDLREPDKKMSKSSPPGCVFLDDSPDDVRLKLRKATATEAGLENLHFLYAHFVGGPLPQQNKELKDRLAEALVERLK